MPEHLTEHHRLVSQQKRAAVLHAADAMIDQGVAFHWTTLARRARVSVKFINDPKHADLKEHVKERLAAAYDQQAAQAVAASNATAAQLRVKVANHAAQLRRQDHVIKMLSASSANISASEIAADLPAITGAALASKPDSERIAELERRVVELEDELLERGRRSTGCDGSAPGDPKGRVRVTGWPAAPAETAFHGLRASSCCAPSRTQRLTRWRCWRSSSSRSERRAAAAPTTRLRRTLIIRTSSACWWDLPGRDANARPGVMCAARSPVPTPASWDGCLASGLSSGEGLIAQVRDTVDDADADADADAPADKRRLVLEGIRSGR